MFPTLSKSITYILVLFIGITVYYIGWNKGYNVGVKDVHDTDIIMGDKIVCRYKEHKH